MTHWCWRLLVLLGALLIVAKASAAGGTARVSLRWAAPNECPDDVQLVHDVERLLGQSLLDAGEQALTVHAVVRVESGVYSAALHFISAQGEEDRTLEHPSCESLVQAIALVVALAIDPERVRATQSARDAAVQGVTSGLAPPPVPSPPEPVELGSPTQEAPPLAPSTLASASREVNGAPLTGLRFGLHGVAGAGSLPNFGAGLDAVVGWHRRGVRVEGVGRYWVPRQHDIQRVPSAALDLQLATLGARVCWQPRLAEAWRVAACAGVDVGSLHGDGVGLQNQHSRDARYTDLASGLQVAYAHGHLLPEAGVEFLRAVERPLFGIVQNGVGSPEFRPAAWGFVVSAGLSFEL